MSTKVTVIILTYNHEKYIEQAIESILTQEIDFEIHIIVADDGSFDKTPIIIKTIQQKTDIKITLLRHKKNQGVLKNLFRIIEQVKSDYVAILDGDDYWDYRFKLKTQVDFLDKNENYNAFFHDAKIIHDELAEKQLFEQKKFYSQSYQYKSILSNIDILERKMILPSSSALFRLTGFGNVNLSLLNDDYSLLWKISCFLIKNSQFYFANEPWSVYRNHSLGISKKENLIFHLSHIKFLKELLKDDYFKNSKFEIYSALSNEYKVIIESKNINISKRKNKFLGFYLISEFKKNWYYYHRVKSNKL
jgi:glycosyltransferase involved in cell wall biosynthesis